MPRKGLTMEEILSTAAMLVEEKGFEQFSLRELAGQLQVKPSSLYNHTANVAELTAGVGHIALQTLYDQMQAAGEGLEKSEKLIAIAKAYREYARRNPELYKAIANLPALEGEALKVDSCSIMEALYEILDAYALNEDEKINFARTYRSAMHGFVSLEAAGYFKGGVSADDSYQYLIESLLCRIACKNEERKQE